MAVPPFTAKPCPGHTLPIADWLVDGLRRAPRLCYVISLVAKDRLVRSHTTKKQAKYSGLCLTTFTNGSDTLVHAQQDVRCIEGSAVCGFPQWWRNRDEPLQGQPDLKIKEVYLSQGCAKAQCKVSNSCHNPGEEQSVHCEQGWLNDGVVDMTDFEGRPVPCWLLDEVYKQTSHPRFRKEGQRDLQLPEGVWGTLRKWRAEDNVTTQSTWVRA